MGLFPLFVELAGRRCVVLGGGAVAERKVEALLAAGAAVTIVSPEITPALAARAATGAVTHVPRAYAPGDLAGAALAFVATDDDGVAAAASREGRARGVWVNAADDPRHCDVFLAATVRRGPVTVAVGTGGASPALARAVRERIERALPDAYATLGEITASLRRELHASGRRARPETWQAALREALAPLLAGGRPEEAARRLRDRLAATCE